MAPLNKKQEDQRKSRKLQTMKKKLEQLTTLCDVDAFFLCFQHGHHSPSYSWPEDRRSCLSLIGKYRHATLVKEELNKDKRKRKSDSSASSSSSFKKTEKMMFDIHSQNRGCFRFQMSSSGCFEGLESDESRGVLDRINRNRMAVKERIQFLKLIQTVKEEKPCPMFGISDEEHEEKPADTVMVASSGMLESVVLHSGVLAETCKRLGVTEEAMNERAQAEEFSEMESLGYGDADDEYQRSFDFGISLEELDFL